MKRTVKKIKKRKTAGGDGIPEKIWKHGKGRLKGYGKFTIRYGKERTG